MGVMRTGNVLGQARRGPPDTSVEGAPRHLCRMTKITRQPRREKSHPRWCTTTLCLRKVQRSTGRVVEVDAVHRGGLNNEVATGSARHHHNPGSPGQRAPARGEGEQVSARHRAALATPRSCGRSEKAMAHGPTRIGSRPTMREAQGSIGRDIGCNADNPQRTC